MTERLDVIAVGDRLALLLPEEVAARLGASAGGSVETEFRAGEVKSDELAGWMVAAERIMERDKEALARLAR